MIRARIIAASVEGALSAAGACPVYFLMGQAGHGTALSVSTWIAVAFALAPLTLAIRALSQKHPAPEHRRHGLLLCGKGCHLCRWLRFWWPLAAAPTALALGLWVDMVSLAYLGAAATLLHLALGLSALAEDREPHWASRTGFRFDQK